MWFYSIKIYEGNGVLECWEEEPLPATIALWEQSKLSPIAPMILQGWARVGRRRFNKGSIRKS